MRKKLAALLLFCLFTLSACAGPAELQEDSPSPDGSWTPTGPITIVNYVASGGGMDVATREFVKIAAKYTSATFVVDNRPGAGGLIAMDYVLNQPADGCTIFAGTISNVSAVISGEEDTERYIWGFEWIDNIMTDPMAIIVRQDDGIDLDTLIGDARALDGRQIWVGPSTGGIKNIIALKFWDAFGMEATWVPYESGPLAMNALLSGQGVASVGNPSDVSGRALENLVIATGEKLPNFPNVQNFADLGYPELDQVSMWRGFAVKDGTPDEMIAWFQALCQQVTEDPEWIEFFTSKSITVKNDTTEAFETQIQSDIEDHLLYLKRFGLISEDYYG